jgi:hypothetical protein
MYKLVPGANRPGPEPLPAATSERGSLDPKQVLKFAAIALAIVVLANFGFRLYLARSHRPPVVISTDKDVQHDVERKLADSGLFTNEKISVAAHDGVVTLTGLVHDDWKRISAAGNAASVGGVLEVKNLIQVREKAETPAPVWQSSEAPTPEMSAARKPKWKQLDDRLVKAKELVEQGNWYVAHRNYSAALKSFRQALDLDPNNYEARSGIQEAQRFR